MSSFSENTDSAARYATADRLRLLKGMALHPGFIFFCQRWDEKISKEIDARVWDTETSNEEARVLRETRKRLRDGFSPDKILMTLISSCETEVEREKSELT